MKQVAEAAQLPERHLYSEEEPAEEEPEEVTEDGEEQPPPVVEELPCITFADFLDQVVASAETYGQLVNAKTGNPAIDRHLRNLRIIKSLQTYGFLMALRVGGCSDANFTKILKLTEAFLLRRHICRERANENETLFARLCGVDCSNPLPKLTEEFRLLCPSDEKFQLAFAEFDFTPSLIDRARYCLEQFELTRQGGHSELVVSGPDSVHVEHIIPLKIKTKKAKEEFGNWPSYLGAGSEAKHPHYVPRIGNLTLFAGSLNIGVSNNPYERKKAACLQSAIKLTNTLPAEFPEFRFDQVEKRAAEFAKLAVKLWPVP